MPNFQVNPLKIFTINGENCPILCASSTAALASNDLIVTAISGKRIRVMGWSVSSSGAVAGTYFSLRSGSSGTIIWTGQNVPINTYGDSEKLPINEAGYCETATGVGLYMDVNGTTLYYNILYIAYTP